MKKYIVFGINDDEANPDGSFYVATDGKRECSMHEASVIFRKGETFSLAEANAAAKEYATYLNMREVAKEEAAKNITITTAVAHRLAGSP